MTSPQREFLEEHLVESALMMAGNDKRMAVELLERAIERLRG